MSWINENKFVATLAGVTAIISGGILFFGISQSGVYSEKLEEYDELKGSLVKMSSTKPYPNAENLATREEAMAKYESTIDSVYKELQSFKPADLKSLSPEAFSDARVAMERELRSAFTESGTTIPAGCSFGFERYASVQANALATSKLSFQLSATKSLLINLAESKPTALVNIKRNELPIETRRRGGDVKEKREKGGEAKDVYQRLPMELVFTASESSVRAFLKGMVSSKDYFYNINTIRIKNESQRSPTEEDVDFPEAASSEGGEISFADFGDESEPEAEKPAAIDSSMTKASGRVLKQILGNELLHIHLSFDVLLIKDLREAQQ